MIATEIINEINALTAAMCAATPAQMVEVTVEDLVELKNAVARLEAGIASDNSVMDLTVAGMSKKQAEAITRRANNPWATGVSYEAQDAILAELKHLAQESNRHEEIYQQAANAALGSTPRGAGEYAKKLVREENLRLREDPLANRAQRSFRIGSQDKDGMVNVSGRLPADSGALLQLLMDAAFKATAPDDSTQDNRTIAQRNADAFGLVTRWASSQRVETTGHAALVVSVAAEDPMDITAKFATNAGIDLDLVDLVSLSGEKISDYIVVHDHLGAATALYTAGRSANFWQRIALFAEQLVCQHPGCDVHAGRCDAHHVHPWSSGGHTDIDNLVLMCRGHHRRNDDDHRRQHMRKRGGQGVWQEKKYPASKQFCASSACRRQTCARSPRCLVNLSVKPLNLSS